MKITILKSTVETALVPILKMVSATRLSADFHPTLTIQSDKQRITIGCTLTEQQMSIVLPDAICDEKNTSFDVNLEMFRRLLAPAKGTRLSIEKDATHVVLNCDDRFIGQLVPMTSKSDAMFQIPTDADSTVLPTSFANFLLQAFSCASIERDRPLLRGVNVSPRGIAATDGRQLFHLALPLHLKTDVTLPSSKCYAALKSLRWTSLAHWRNIGKDWMFAIVGDGFRYAAKAVEGSYPKYWQIIPEKAGDVKLTLTYESARALQKFLVENSDWSFAMLTIHHDGIKLLETNAKTMKPRTGTFEAKCTGATLPCVVQLNTCYLRQFLKMGFMSMTLSSKSQSPIVSSSGMGTYLFMPCKEPQQDETVETEAPSPAVSSEVLPDSNSVNCSQTNNQPKEKPTMTQTITTPSVPVSRPGQPAPQTNPLDETLASIAAMREQLSNLESRLLEAGRKIKAALVEQRLKERQYADATKKLERIRLAV